MNIKTHEFCREFLESVGPVLSDPTLEYDILAFSPAPLAECVNESQPRFQGGSEPGERTPIW